MGVGEYMSPSIDVVCKTETTVHFIDGPVQKSVNGLAIEERGAPFLHLTRPRYFFEWGSAKCSAQNTKSESQQRFDYNLELCK